MEMGDYTKGLNNSSITKSDILQADRDFQTITQFEPESIIYVPKTKTEPSKGIDGGILALIAATGQGKSILLRHILSVIHSEYDKAFIMCPTIRAQNIYDYFPDSNIFDIFDEEFLIKLWYHQKSIKESNKNAKLDRVLIVLDDIICEKEYKNSYILDKIATSGRHYGITLIILSQTFDRIKDTHRKNLRFFAGYDVDNMNELEKFTSAFMCSVNKRCGRLLYKHITTEKKYQACVVEIYKNSVPISEKVKKFIADPNIKKFKIKSVSKSMGNTKDSKHTNLAKCNYFMELI